MKTICGLALLSLLAWGQDTPALQKTERKLIQLRYIDASRARNLAGVFAGRDLNIEADDHLHWIAVRGPGDLVQAFEDAVKKLDVAPLDFELTVYLVSASTQVADHLPDALASTAKQLHAVFAYKGYELLDSFVLRGRDGQGVSSQGASADGTIKNSTYSFRYNRASVLDGAPKIVNLQNLNLQIRTPTGTFDEKGNPRFKNTGLNSDIDIRDGQKVVVGKSDVNNGESPLILVVTAKVVE
jgi:type II secretory pathway component GspD/PulD (secretin)